MSASPTKLTVSAVETDGGVWYRLHAEREDICDALLLNAPTPDGARDYVSEDFRRNLDRQLQARLIQIDDALDRLMNGTYGECVNCRGLIEVHKVHLDAAASLCLACQRKTELQ